MVKKPHSRKIEEYGLSSEGDDRLIAFLVRTIHNAVKVLAILMTLVILWGIVDVVWMLVTKLKTKPYFLLNLNDILATFGAFLAVLIAIEIFANITMYLREDIIHVRLVLATALMAISRKVIILDYTKHSWGHVAATGVVILALGITFWLLTRKGPTEALASTSDPAADG